MINKIELSDFKNVQSFSTELNSINILIGENNSGKSSVLQGIHFSLMAESVRRKTSTDTVRESDLLYLPSSELIYLPNIYTEIASRIFKKYPQIKIVLQNIFLNLGIASEVIFKKSYIKDIQDISIVVSSATVFPNGILKIELIDGSRMKITL